MKNSLGADTHWEEGWTATDLRDGVALMTRHEMVRSIRVLGEAGDAVGFERLSEDAIRRRLILACAKRIKRLNDHARLVTQGHAAAPLCGRRPRVIRPAGTRFA